MEAQNRYLWTRDNQPGVRCLPPLECFAPLELVLGFAPLEVALGFAPLEAFEAWMVVEVSVQVLWNLVVLHSIVVRLFASV